MSSSSLPPPDSVRFLVVGDIGEGGKHRAAVGEAIERLVSVLPVAFAVTNGDNVYGKPSGKAAEDLKRELLSRVRVPWCVALGNHDVGKEALAWHKECFSASAFPGGCYSATDVLGAGVVDPSLLELVVVNTNRFSRSTMKASPAVPEENNWWSRQKQWVEARLAASSAPCRIVLGHHPIEYVPQNLVEHKLPGVRYFPTTFMKGGPSARIRKTGMRDHVVRGGADLYIAGHQHLMAHLTNAKKGRTEYVIVGSSSKLEPDAGDYSDDDGESSSSSSSSSSGSGLKDMLLAKLSRKVNGDEEEEKVLWCREEPGFLVVEATRLSGITVTFYTVDMEKRSAAEVYRRTVG